ncbi:MAG TPA: 16S rRNA (cytosine(967)-C(5))-methyltransferase RsmB [Caproiciproducens sp.]|nr:16S rRNA (cytosine(967)-C(5))-methyltransferase RsmB [Caproiciproducens sp.]
MDNARSAALAALLHVDVDEGYSNIVLDKTLASFSLNPRDKALASTIFYGVLERRITLDYYISQFSKMPIKKLAPQVLEILRIGVYQILYLDRIPNSAAVNESVNLAKENNFVKASGFINAILRSVIRNINSVKLPDPQKERLQYLSVNYSCPKWIISLWQQYYGPECTLGLLESLLNRPPVFAKVNNIVISKENLIKRLESEGVKATAITWLENALSLEQTGSISSLPSFLEGLFHIQDLSSQLCCYFLNPQPGQSVVDVCAAPGGKTFTLAEQMDNRGELLSFDQYKGKVRLIQQGAQRLGLTIIKAGVRDASNPSDLLKPVDRVLCDVPCSGLGIIRRKPEIRYKLQSTIDSLPDLQYRILCESSRLVKGQGILVYSTCTLNPRENNQVADKFLENHPEFIQYPLVLPETLTHAIQEPDNQLTLMPHLHGTDGFFIAAFQKR